MVITLAHVDLCRIFGINSEINIWLSKMEKYKNSLADGNGKGYFLLILIIG
jgi:hypothetical protein